MTDVLQKARGQWKYDMTEKSKTMQIEQEWADKEQSPKQQEIRIMTRQK